MCLIFNLIKTYIYHYIKDLVFKKLIKIKFIDTKNNISDMFTKALNKISFAVDLQVL